MHIKKENQLIWEAYLVEQQERWKNLIFNAVQQVASNVASSKSFKIFVNTFRQPRYLVDEFNQAREIARAQGGVNLQNFHNELFNSTEGAIDAINRKDYTSAEQLFNRLKTLVPDRSVLSNKMNEFNNTLNELGLRKRQDDFQKQKLQQNQQ